MFERLSNPAREAITVASEKARQYNHSSITPEHLLLALLTGMSTNALKLLRDMGVVPEELAELLASGMTIGTAPSLPSAPSTQLPQDGASKRVIESAILESREFRHGYVGTEHLLLGILNVGDTPAAQGLAAIDITLTTAREELHAMVERNEYDPES